MGVWHVLGLDEADWGETGLFFVTIGVLVALVTVGLVNPSLLTSTLNGAYDWVLHNFGWWFMLLGGVMIVFGLFMTFSRYGKIRIGGEDAEPEFGLYSWIAMVFTVGFGSSIVVWGVGEPVQIVNNPPPQPFPVGGAALKPLALAFMFLHESFPGMAMWYIPVTLSFALMIYTQSVSEYKLSSMLDVVFDREEHGWLYWLVDLSALVAMVGGIATSLGFTAQQLATILDTVYGLQATTLTYGLFALIGLVFLGDVWLGLRSGIQNAARLTMVFMALAAAMLLVVGPTLFTLNLTLDATGIWLNNLPRLMFYAAPTSGGSWPQQWTSFWWAWWVAWGLFVGSFVARVSKGRTIRETFVALVVVPSGLVWAQHGIIGGWVLSPEYFGPVSDALAANDIPAAVATAISITPYGNVLGVLLVLVMVGYILTTLDSAVFMLSAITLGDENPNARNRAWWGVLLAFLGVMTLRLPAFSAMQSFSPVMALPFTLYFLVLVYGSYITARDYYREELAMPDEEPFFSFTTRTESTTGDEPTGGDGYTTDGGVGTENDD
ncbi:BCCT family transporter [Halococcus saccharolyticus]|uniref:BCCT transporter n=1 Tax=Halococcus saccharolyticus DSM 5350 TaxID=1227455 RepID=M0MKZ9_9EURY|nr:BCCT family transporter [Halococcus saccharolyticus]EMA45414.1 BCCT transporter [Halococcus saccharolyticus DSM 5350]